MTEFFDTNNPVPKHLAGQSAGRVESHHVNVRIHENGSGPGIFIGNQPRLRHGGVPTYKQWLQLQGRKFLVEEVPYPRIAPQLSQLSMTGRVNITSTNMVAADSILNKTSHRRLLPPMRRLKPHE